MDYLSIKLTRAFTAFIILFLVACSSTSTSVTREPGGGGTAGEVDVTSPTDGSTGVSINVSAIGLHLENIDNMNNSNIDFSPNINGAVVNTSGTDYEFQPSGVLSEFTTYTVTISGLTDQSGDPVSDMSSSFTTGSDLSTSYDCQDLDTLCVDDNSSSNQEYSTIKAAIDASQAGDTVLVFEGNYSGFRVAKSGTSSQRLKIIAGSSSVFLTGSEPQGNNAIRIQNSSYITIEGFTINRTGNGPNSYDYDNACIAARGASSGPPMNSIHLVNNLLIECKVAGMYLSSVSNLLISRNTIDSTKITSDGSAGMGIYMANSETKNAIVIDNKIINNAGHGIHLNGDSSVGGNGIQSGHVIERNAIIGNGISGFNMDGVQSSLVKNNVFANNGRHGMRGFQIDGSQGPADFIIVNNTFFGNASSPTKFSADSGGHVVFNNIIIDNGANAFDFENNNYSISNNLFSTDETSTFVDASNIDFRLNSGSAAINAGTSSFASNSAASDDLSKTPRNGTPDLGALELGSDNPVWY